MEFKAATLAKELGNLKLYSNKRLRGTRGARSRLVAGVQNAVKGARMGELRRACG